MAMEVVYHSAIAVVSIDFRKIEGMMYNYEDENLFSKTQLML
jgi:hypothetical protein